MFDDIETAQWVLNSIRRSRPQPPHEAHPIVGGKTEVYHNLTPYALALLIYDNNHIIPWKIARHFTSKSIWEETGVNAD